MSRCAQHNRVFFIEEPVFEAQEVYLKEAICPRTGVHVITPFLPSETRPEATPKLLQQLLNDLIQKEQIRNFIAWYYTPMAVEFTGELSPELTIYDCMDELSAFANAPAGMFSNERKLFEQADLIFTGGLSLYEAKCQHHKEVHLFPSSVDRAHFSRARVVHQDPPDQKVISYPRIGYAGVIDERMDLQLLSYIADRRPDWHIVLLGPMVKVNPNDLPRRPNIHRLGMKDYQDLPAYFSGWNVALLPFAQNNATRFISPTKTPEYLSAGLPVVSTPIRDVERPYGELGLVVIGRSHEDFLKGIESQLREGRSQRWQSQVNSFLSRLSWDKTWSEMERLILRDLGRKKQRRTDSEIAPMTTFNPDEASAARV
ncbi:MAG TPA: glycosyltransferase [Bryobacteraceae bacterium]|nr:glycosyltransferase [Bryobacteraceae bacterium]